jgi:copper oxidase (laccase) domain-containing protein
MYSSPLFADQPGVIHGFSDAQDGNMDFRFGAHDAVLENRRRFLHGVGLSLDECVQQQWLEDAVRVVSRQDLGHGMRDLDSRIHANAFITNQAGVGLFLCIADCLPIIIYDPRKHVVALLHAARESTNRKLSANVVDRMESEFGSDASTLLVAFGPAVRAESYIFDEGIYALVGEEWGTYLKEIGPGQIAVDYVAYNRDQLLEAGVQSKHILDPGIDTGKDPHYFSHVRSSKTGQPEARLAAVVALR